MDFSKKIIRHAKRQDNIKKPILQMIQKHVPLSIPSCQVASSSYNQQCVLWCGWRQKICGALGFTNSKPKETPAGVKWLMVRGSRTLFPGFAYWLCYLPVIYISTLPISNLKNGAYCNVHLIGLLWQVNRIIQIGHL